MQFWFVTIFSKKMRVPNINVTVGSDLIFVVIGEKEASELN